MNTSLHRGADEAEGMTVAQHLKITSLLHKRLDFLSPVLCVPVATPSLPISSLLTRHNESRLRFCCLEVSCPMCGLYRPDHIQLLVFDQQKWQFLMALFKHTFRYSEIHCQLKKYSFSRLSKFALPSFSHNSLINYVSLLLSCAYIMTWRHVIVILDSITWEGNFPNQLWLI